jgi:enamine deaminase RidA (YjgF/YER057c/UK114 family)
VFYLFGDRIQWYFLADLADFDGMNAVWDAWVVPGQTPPRATVQARLANPQWRIEVVVTAAVAPDKS